MKKTVKETRLDSVKKWIETHSKDLTDKQKLKTYPTWIKVMEDKGQTEMAKILYDEIEKIKSKKSNFIIFIDGLKNFFNKLIKKGS